jgi:molybdenum cofactor sulfurtransferase
MAHNFLGKTYLDHGGTTIYAKSLIDSFAADLVSNLYGNPHSASAPAKLSGQAVDDIRERTLQFFGADPEHFDLVFVANATAATKLAMECFQDLGRKNKTPDGDEEGFWYGYHVDSHNSLIGARARVQWPASLFQDRYGS